MKYKVTFHEDYHNVIEEVIIEVDDGENIEDLVDDYYNENLSNEETICGANWTLLEEGK